MAAFDTFGARTTTGALDRASRFVSHIVNSVIDWNQSRLTRKALSQLTAHELDDIGLSPADIERF